MDKKTWIIVGVLVAAFGVLAGISIMQGSSQKAELSVVHEASDENGWFGEMIEGNPDAPVKIYEYGDYQCDACAPMNPYVNDLVEEYDGKLAVVFRGVVMSYHQNGIAAASAALAAAKQGYWLEYKDFLYTNQDDWFYSDADQRQKQFEDYFMKVTDNKGDLEQFVADMGSSEVSKKISFDADLAKQHGVSYTPYFFVEDEFVSQSGMTREEFMDLLREKINARLEAVEFED